MRLQKFAFGTIVESKFGPSVTFPTAARKMLGFSCNDLISF